GDAVEIDHAGDLDGRSKPSRFRQHAYHEREMSAGRAAHDQDLVGINFVIAGVIPEPPGGVQDVVHRCRRGGCFRETIFHVCHHEVTLDERRAEALTHAFFIAANPATPLTHDA